MSSEPSKRTYAPTWAMRPATSGECRNIENGPCRAPRLLTMLSDASRPAAGTCAVLVISGSRAMDASSGRAGARILRPPRRRQRRSGRDALGLGFTTPGAVLRHRPDQVGRHLRDVRIAARDHALFDRARLRR